MALNISQHLDKNNLHHAYFIEGKREEVVSELLEFFKSLKIKISGNPDFLEITLDSFKIEDARNLRAQATEKGISQEKDSKKIFLILANSFQPEAQNTMLKLFEEPIENTHFFVVAPDVDALLPTLISRFYLIRTEHEGQLKDAEKFIGSPLPVRINFIKELLAEAGDEEDLSADSARSKAKVFLNSLELALHGKIFSTKGVVPADVDFFRQIFKAREFLRQSGSSAKTLMEAVALNIPTIK